MSACQSTKAQTFNTITNTQPHYKVEQSVMHKPKDISLTDDSAKVNTPSSVIDSQAITKETEQTRCPLSVSYPLRQSKLHISSPYGNRRHPILGRTKFHNGVDIRAKREPVYAMLPGKVVKTGYDNISGNFITLQHGSILVSYCHLSVIGIEKGASVYAGQPLGIAGTTGRSTGVHLHLTLKVNGQATNPMPLLELIGKQLTKS